MGISDKLKFWQKEDDDFSDLGDFGLGDDVGSGNKPPADDMFGSGGDPFSAPAQGMQQPTTDPFAAAPQQGPAPATPPPSGTDMFGSVDQRPQQPVGPMTPPVQMPQPQQQMHPAPAPQVYSQDDYQKETFTKDVEIISAKLDSLRATLESINQRLANIERLAQGEQQGKRKYEW